MIYAVLKELPHFRMIIFIFLVFYFQPYETRNPINI